jgi:transposase InsO family protein
LDRKIVTPSKKGTGFIQPLKIHQEWHTDVTYLNVGGTFFFLITVLDGFSRYIVHWDLRESMTEYDVELVIAKGLETHPGVTPRIISDNGPQFIAKDFKEFVREYGLTHVRTSPYYPQSNGKMERWYGSLKTESIRPSCPATKAEAEQRILRYVTHYNTVRLHSAIGYVTPADCLAGLREVIGAERDRKLEEARQRRQTQRAAANCGEQVA